MPLSSFNFIIYLWIALALFTFLLLLKVTAPYGRHTKSNWGPMIDNRIAWFLMESPALIFPTIFYFAGQAEKNPVVWCFYLLFMLHYLNRAFIYSFRIRTRGKKMPIVIVLMAVFFNVINGYFIGYYLGNYSYLYDISWFTDWRFIIGIILFTSGIIINWKSDNILIGLRKESRNGYQIPQGSLFKYISCPNHLGEVIEWIGFAWMTWSLAGLSFAIWSMANLIPRALDHHKWYIEHFDDYPSERKAIIPYLL
ncbi:MAG: DUF1295 domain-containing protein [Bacteroidetes bacterium]|nr:DUF1295 domain-containing protein [Bacteroidota bacterium]